MNVKTLNSRKQIFCPECESTSFVKINLRKNFIFEFYFFIYDITPCFSVSILEFEQVNARTLLSEHVSKVKFVSC